MANVLATLSQHRVASYVVVSASLLAGTVARAVERNSNFYSIAVDLSRNSSSVLVRAVAYAHLMRMTYVYGCRFLPTLESSYHCCLDVSSSRYSLDHCARVSWRHVSFSDAGVLPRSSRIPSSQRLYDRVWFFLTESLLAWTIFRDELDTSFGILFGLLLFAKCFHWLLQDRIEWVSLAIQLFVCPST